MEIHWTILINTSLRIALEINKISNFLDNWFEDSQVKTIKIKGFYLLLRRYKIIRRENYGTIIITKIQKKVFEVKYPHNNLFNFSLIIFKNI